MNKRAESGELPGFSVVIELTRLPRAAPDGLAPGPGPDGVEGLDLQLVLGPLLQLLQRALPRQAVPQHPQQGRGRRLHAPGPDPVPHGLGVPVVLRVRERLPGDTGKHNIPVRTHGSPRRPELVCRPYQNKNDQEVDFLVHAS